MTLIAPVASPTRRFGSHPGGGPERSAGFAPTVTPAPHPLWSAGRGGASPSPAMTDPADSVTPTRPPPQSWQAVAELLEQAGFAELLVSEADDED